MELHYKNNKVLHLLLICLVVIFQHVASLANETGPEILNITSQVLQTDVSPEDHIDKSRVTTTTKRYRHDITSTLPTLDQQSDDSSVFGNTDNGAIDNETAPEILKITIRVHQTSISSEDHIGRSIVTTTTQRYKHHVTSTLPTLDQRSDDSFVFGNNDNGVIVNDQDTDERKVVFIDTTLSEDSGGFGVVHGAVFSIVVFLLIFLRCYLIWGRCSSRNAPTRIFILRRAPDDGMDRPLA